MNQTKKSQNNSPTPKELLIKLKDILEKEIEVRQKHLAALDERIDSLIPAVYGPLPSPPALHRHINPSTGFENKVKQEFFKTALNNEEEKAKNRGESFDYKDAHEWVEKMYEAHLKNIERERKLNKTIYSKVMKSLMLDAAHPTSAHRPSPYRVTHKKSKQKKKI